MMKQFILAVGFLLYGGSLFSQPWLNHLPKQKSNSARHNFYDIQTAFSSYWSNKKIEKGKGYKQFKRWEAFMLPRVYPLGYFPTSQTWLEYQKLRAKNTKSTVVSDWKPLGPNVVPNDNDGNPSGVGRVNCIAFHPSNTNIIYVGAPAGGLWKSVNGGGTWSTTTNELSSLGVSDIAINPDNTDIMYIATGDGDAGDTYSIGVLQSVDGGDTWKATGLSSNLVENIVIRRLIINPSDPSILLAATSQGIYRTNNAGADWTNAQPGHFKDLEFNPANPDIVYAARYGANSSRFYKSEDGGVSFEQINTGVDLSETYRLELAVSGVDNPDIIYALYSERENDGFHSLWKSENAGNNWTKVYDASKKNLLGWKNDGSDIGGQGWYDLSLAVSPFDAKEVYVGGVNVWKSVNSGSEWNFVGDWEGITSAYIHADHHCLVYSSSSVLYSGNDGGIYKTNNGGETWLDISNGLDILQIDRIGTSQFDPTLVIAGSQDNGTMKYNNSDESWVQIYGGDGAECIIDKNDKKNLYISYVNGDFQRSTDGGLTFASIKPNEVDEGAWHTPLVMNPENSNILYCGFNDVWKSTNKGDKWDRISMNLSNAESLTQLAVAPSNTNYIYVSTGTRHWVTKNGGLTWVEIISSDLPNLYLKYFAIADNNPERIWAVFSGFEEGKKVYFSERGGDSWINVSKGLPNVPANCIIRERQSNDVLYLATDIGVFYRDASKDSWERFNSNLPNLVVSELEIQYTDALLRAGTRGRGLWETTITLSNPDAPYIVSASITPAGNQIELLFNRPMMDPTGKQGEFVVNDGDPVPPTSIQLKEGTNNVYIITLPVEVNEGGIVTVSYTEGSVLSLEGGKLSSFVNKGVENNLGSTIFPVDETNSIKVFPNPNNGTFVIECRFNKSTQVLIKLISLNGQLVYQKEFRTNQYQLKQSVSIPENIKGTFLLVVEGGNKKYQQTVVLE
jgi:photosystem II stability/assembly factor-like uncharacterized protein